MTNTRKTYFFDYSIMFLQNYLPKRGRSIHTISSYRDTLTIFKDWLEATGKNFTIFKFSEFTVDTAYNFLEWLKSDRKNSEETCNHRLHDLCGYIDYCVTQDVALASVYTLLKRVKPYKTVKKIKDWLTSEQVKLIIDSCPNTKKGKRDKLIILMLYETAVRVSELANLCISNVYLDDEFPFIQLVGKGKKERTIPLIGNIPKLLKDYINEDVKYSGSEYIFYTMHKGKPEHISSRSIQEMITRSADKARLIDSSIPDRVYPHMFRRSKATSLYQNGMVLEQVSSLLGHSQLETTRIYAKASIAQIRENMEKATPQKDIEAEPLWQGKTKDLNKLYGLR